MVIGINTVNTYNVDEFNALLFSKNEAQELKVYVF